MEPREETVEPRADLVLLAIGFTGAEPEGCRPRSGSSSTTAAAVDAYLR